MSLGQTLIKIVQNTATEDTYFIEQKVNFLCDKLKQHGFDKVASKVAEDGKYILDMINSEYPLNTFNLRNILIGDKTILEGRRIGMETLYSHLLEYLEKAVNLSKSLEEKGLMKESKKVIENVAGIYTTVEYEHPFDKKNLDIIFTMPILKERKNYNSIL